MTKAHYISFIAAVSSERIQLVKWYPEEEAEAAYSDYEIRRKQEKIMDVFYQFGELMNLDPCDEKVQKVAGGNGSLEFARKVMREFYQTR